MHFPPNPPSVDPGVSAFLWGVVFGFFVWIGLEAIGAPGGTAALFGTLTLAVSFLYIRTAGTAGRRRDAGER